MKILPLLLAALCFALIPAEAVDAGPPIHLAVLENGRYEVAGKLVAASRLAERLRALKRRNPRLRVSIVPSPKAKYAAVQAAVVACQTADATLDLIGSEASQ